MDLVKVLEHLRPQAAWELIGDTYEGLTWNDTEQIKPTLEECEDTWLYLEGALEREIVREARRDLYVQTSDAIFFKWQRDEATKEDWLDSIELVRQTYPYPEDVIPEL